MNRIVLGALAALLLASAGLFWPSRPEAAILAMLKNKD